MDWSNEKVLRLVAEYKARPSLWDNQDYEFKNRVRKNKAWEEIANIFNMPRLEVERKLKILLVQYRREKVKISKMVEMGYDIKELEGRAWYAYKSFSFLEMRPKLKKSADYIELDNTNNLNDTEYEEIKMEKIEPALEVSEEYASNENDIEEYLQSTIITNPEVKKPKLMAPTSTTTSTNVQSSRDDDIELFASYVASEMRCLSNPQLKKKLRTKILKAILEIHEEDDSNGLE